MTMPKISKKRAAGRPPGSADTGRVRERLLAEAVRLFSKQGYEGVAVDEIVSAAGVNKQMVYHYFKSKQGLYEASLQSVFDDLGRLEERLIRAEAGRENPLDSMRRLAEAYFRFLHSHPEFVRMLLWENLGTWKDSLRGSALRKTSVLNYLTALLESGRELGAFRSGLDARLVFTSLIGLCLVYFSNRHTFKESIGLDFSRAVAAQRARSHAIDFFLAGLSNGSSLGR